MAKVKVVTGRLEPRQDFFLIVEKPIAK